MKTRILLAMIMVLAVSSPTLAQGDWWFGMAYETSLASGSTTDFTGALSWRGASFSGRRLVKDNVSTGFWTAWHVMNDSGVETVNLQDEGFDFSADVTGDFFRYINSFPLMLNAHWYSGLPGNTRIAAGLNAGVYYIERRVETGVYAVTVDNWHFGLAPELSVVTPMGWHARGFLGARYNWAASAGGSGSITYFNFFVGVAWM